MGDSRKLELLLAAESFEAQNQPVEVASAVVAPWVAAGLASPYYVVEHQAIAVAVSVELGHHFAENTEAPCLGAGQVRFRAVGFENRLRSSVDRLRLIFGAHTVLKQCSDAEKAGHKTAEELLVQVVLAWGRERDAEAAEQKELGRHAVVAAYPTPYFESSANFVDDLHEQNSVEGAVDTHSAVGEAYFADDFAVE